MHALRVVTVASVLLCTGTAAAQPAKALVAKGLEHYDQKRYTEAIEAFEAAYKKSKDAKLLFNIAQAYRLLENCTAALAYYQHYLVEAPNAPNQRAVRYRITEMTACVASKQKGEPAVAPGPAPSGSTDLMRPEPEPKTTRVEVRTNTRSEGGQGLRITGLVAGGIGLALSGVGVYFALDARSAQNDVEALFDRPDGTWDQSLQDRGERSALLSRVFFISGGVALATGVVLYVVGRKQEHLVVTPTASAEGATVWWRGSF